MFHNHGSIDARAAYTSSASTSISVTYVYSMEQLVMRALAHKLAGYL